MNLGAFTTMYGLAGGVIPFLVLAPYYFSGDISLGSMFQIEALIRGVQESLDFFVGAYADIADWRASTGRLLALESTAEQLSAEGTSRFTEHHAVVPPLTDLASSQQAYSTMAPPTLAGTLSAKALTLKTTAGALVLANIDFEWLRGDLVSLEGPSAGAKTT